MSTTNSTPAMAEPSKPTADDDNPPSPTMNEQHPQQPPSTPKHAASPSTPTPPSEHPPSPSPNRPTATPPSPSFSLLDLSPYDTISRLDAGAHVSSFLNEGMNAFLEIYCDDDHRGEVDEAGVLVPPSPMERYAHWEEDEPWGVCGEGEGGARDEGGERERRVSLVLGDADKMFPQLDAETSRRDKVGAHYADEVEARYKYENEKEQARIEFMLQGYATMEAVDDEVDISADEVPESYSLIRPPVTTGNEEKKRKYETVRMRRSLKKQRKHERKEGEDEIVCGERDREMEKERGRDKEMEKERGRDKEKAGKKEMRRARSVSSHCSGYSSSCRVRSFSVSDEEVC